MLIQLYQSIVIINAMFQFLDIYRQIVDFDWGFFRKILLISYLILRISLIIWIFFVRKKKRNLHLVSLANMHQIGEKNTIWKSSQGQKLFILLFFLFFFWLNEGENCTCNGIFSTDYDELLCYIKQYYWMKKKKKHIENIILNKSTSNHQEKM